MSVKCLDRFAVSMYGPYVYIGLAGANRRRAAALLQVRIDQRPEVLIRRLAVLPDPVQFEINIARKAERAPNPLSSGVVLFHLNHLDGAHLIRDHCVKKFRMRNRKE